MELFFWQYDLPPGFAFDCVRYTVKAAQGPLHWHNYYQLALCVRGSGTFHFSQKEYAYAAGDLFVVDNTEQHGAFAAQGQTAEFIFTMFYPQFVLRDAFDAFDGEYLLPFAYRSETFCNRIAAKTPIAQTLGALLLDLERENKARRRGYQHIISAKLRVILAELIAHYEIGDEARATLERYRKLRPAVLYVEQHCCEPITLEQAARAAFLSPSRFSHLFRETMHVGFKEYVIGMRYETAKRLLTTDDRPVEEIAAACGFSNLSSFYRLFHARENTTPAGYRAAHFSQ